MISLAQRRHLLPVDRAQENTSKDHRVQGLGFASALWSSEAAPQATVPTGRSQASLTTVP